MTLSDERIEWRSSFEQGMKPESLLLEDYRKKRLSNQWRASRQAEQLCEYILYLEDRLDDIG